MASIATTISLIDGVTAPVNKMIDSINKLTGSYQSLSQVSQQTTTKQFQ